MITSFEIKDTLSPQNVLDEKNKDAHYFLILPSLFEIKLIILVLETAWFLYNNHLNNMGCGLIVLKI